MANGPGPAGKPMSAKTGDATIKKVGHTADGNFGSGINDQPAWGKGTAADLSIR